MRIIKKVIFFLSICFLTVLNAQTKTFEIIPQFPKPREQFTISYNPIATNLKNATEILGLMYIYDNFKWIVKDFSLIKTRVGTWETREQLSDHAALVCCVFYSDSEIDNGGKQTYSLIIENSPGSYLGWAMLQAPVFQNDIPVKVDASSLVNDSVTLKRINTEIIHYPQSRLVTFYPLLRLSKILEPTTAREHIKSELRYVLKHSLDNLKQYDVQKTLKLLEETKDKMFIDSVQNVLVKTYPEGVLARDLALKKIFLEPNPVLKSKAYFSFVQKFPKSEFEEVYTEAEHLYNDQIYKAIINYSIKKDNDISILMNSLKELSFANLIHFSRDLISISFNSKKTSVEILKVYILTMMPEIQARENYVPKEYREKLSLNQWRKIALQNVAPEYFSFAKIFEKLQNYKESQRLLEKIKPEFGYKNASFNEMYYRMLIRNEKITEAKSFFEECVKENKVSAEMLGVAKKYF